LKFNDVISGFKIVTSNEPVVYYAGLLSLLSEKTGLNVPIVAVCGAWTKIY
jgi:hypothetical protein